MSDRQEVWAVSPRGEGKKDWWTRVGTAFRNKDDSWTIMLDALPTNGKLIMREEQQRDQRTDDAPPRRERGRAAARPHTRGTMGAPAADDYRGADDDNPF